MSDDTMVDVTGLDLAGVVLALYHGTTELGMGRFQAVASFTLDDAREVVRAIGSDAPPWGARWYIDYLHGRPLKVRFGDEADSGQLDVAMYDRDAGAGQGKRVIEALRAKASR